MPTIYVFKNELLGENGDDFDNALVNSKTCDTDAKCLAWFEDLYGSNDYSSSFTAPEHGDLFGRTEG